MTSPPPTRWKPSPARPTWPRPPSLAMRGDHDRVAPLLARVLAAVDRGRIPRVRRQDPARRRPRRARSGQPRDRLRAAQPALRRRRHAAASPLLLPRHRRPRRRGGALRTAPRSQDAAGARAGPRGPRARSAAGTTRGPRPRTPGRACRRRGVFRRAPWPIPRAAPGRSSGPSFSWTTESGCDGSGGSTTPSPSWERGTSWLIEGAGTSKSRLVSTPPRPRRDAVSLSATAWPSRRCGRRAGSADGRAVRGA